MATDDRLLIPWADEKSATDDAMHFELQAMVKHKDGSVTPHHFGQERGVSAAAGGAMLSIAAALLMRGSQLLPAVQRLVGRCQQRSRRIYGHRRTAAGILQDAVPKTGAIG